jgi:addiction module RelB/DinJ family antitoxin
MATTTFSIRLDEEVKQQLDAFCRKIGISTNAIFSLFANKVVMEKRIPFEIADTEAQVKHHQWIYEQLGERERAAGDPQTKWLTEDEVMKPFRSKYGSKV